MEIPNAAKPLIALEALRNQQYNLELVITDLLELLKSMPVGETRTDFSTKLAAWIRSRV